MVGKTKKAEKVSYILKASNQRNPTISLQSHPKTHDHLLPDDPNTDC